MGFVQVVNWSTSGFMDTTIQLSLLQPDYFNRLDSSIIY